MPQQTTTDFKRLAILTLAFSLLTCISLLMNMRLFPLIDGALPFFRESCAGVYAVVLIVMGVLCAKMRMDRLGKLFDIAAFALPVLAMFVMVAGFIVSSDLIMEIGALLSCMGRAVILMYVGVSLSILPHFDMVVAVAIGFLVQRAASLAFGLLSDFMVIFLFCFMPLLSLALAYTAGKEFFAQIGVAHSASELSVTNPFSFVPFKSLFMLSLFMYQLVFGFSVRLGEGMTTVVYESWIVAPLAVMVVLAALKTKHPNADDLNDIAILVVIAAFLLILIDPTKNISVPSSLLSAASSIFNIVTWVALLGLIPHNKLAGPAVIGFGRGVCALGSIVGAQVGILTNELIETNPFLVSYLAASMVFLLVVFAFLVMRHFSFAGTADDLVPMTLPAEQDDAQSAVETACETSMLATEKPDLCEGKSDSDDSLGKSSLPAAAKQLRETDYSCLDELLSQESSQSPQEASDSCAAQSEEEARRDLRRGFDERCFALAEKYGLTEREKEVFLLLARGRNRDYIQEALVISKNTVKVHVKHIYQKMDVHSHQELIDMVVTTL